MKWFRVLQKKEWWWRKYHFLLSNSTASSWKTCEIWKRWFFFSRVYKPSSILSLTGGSDLGRSRRIISWIINACTTWKSRANKLRKPVSVRPLKAEVFIRNGFNDGKIWSFEKRLVYPKSGHQNFLSIVLSQSYKFLHMGAFGMNRALYTVWVSSMIEILFKLTL